MAEQFDRPSPKREARPAGRASCCLPSLTSFIEGRSVGRGFGTGGQVVEFGDTPGAAAEVD
jgi:hypothetical protein